MPNEDSGDLDVMSHQVVLTRIPVVPEYSVSKICRLGWRLLRAVLCLPNLLDKVFDQ